MTDINEAEAYSRLTNYCAAGEHCKAEVAEKMQRWGIAYSTINTIVDRLIREGYIDEERYCRAFVHDKYRIDHWGKQKIAHALRLKKIAPTFYLPILNEIPRAEYMQILRDLLASKRKSLRATTPDERDQMLLRFAYGRGFDIEDIKEIISSVNSEQ